MIDDCGAALDDEAPSENDEENQSNGRRLIEFVPAAMIVGLALTIASALLRGAESAPTPLPEDSVPAQSPSAPEAESARFRFAAMPLRAALKEMSDRTGSVQQVLPASVTPALRLSQDRARIERRMKARANAQARSRAILLARTAKEKKTDPFTAVGRTASAMAERFTTDLRALPGQISTIFNGR